MITAEQTVVLKVDSKVDWTVDSTAAMRVATEAANLVVGSAAKSVACLAAMKAFEMAERMAAWRDSPQAAQTVDATAAMWAGAKDVQRVA